MIQYLKLLNTIKKKGTYKPAARANMPGTQSYFGYQMRHNLADGFPLLTTKKMYWKGVVIELIWFLNGDSNIKFLVKNGVNIWNEDAYQYYCKIIKDRKTKNTDPWTTFIPMEFDEFIAAVTDETLTSNIPGYELGDCGFQYGRVWRKWEKHVIKEIDGDDFIDKNRGIKNKLIHHTTEYIDQIGNIVNALRKNPESRRHLVNAIDPAHENDLALYWCHAMFQFNCRPLSYKERVKIYRQSSNYIDASLNEANGENYITNIMNGDGIPKYYLDCQLYQRSADVFLGVPFNIASYALLTHILAKMSNMIPGEFIHTFGDVHIYDNHIEAVDEQLTRTPSILPTLEIYSCPEVNWEVADLNTILKSIKGFEEKTFEIKNYNPQNSIKAKLSTGLK